MSEMTRESVLHDMQEAADRMGLDLEDLQEMIVDVLDDFQEKVKQLQEALNTGDHSTVKAISHDIKGAAANYGLELPSQLASEVEKDFEGQPLEAAKKLVAVVETLCGLNLDQE
ncbi:MAG: hypothetical protein COB67_05165 [SAR324 cluster bacterium]|uniref:HPt domain-containing protein n=1 Tax=SAR324 cluster bacterium TaxID=2024889 RepID=A0A2A4T776_9DELT|nr:MAG: hypothetical protein COB67_05165 [SAR324 cluster bacterium]